MNHHYFKKANIVNFVMIAISNDKAILLFILVDIIHMYIRYLYVFETIHEIR